MSTPKQDPEVHAVNTIVQSLRPLDTEAQQRVLQSALALLGLAIATQSHSMTTSGSAQMPTTSIKTSASDGKKKGLTELLLEKNPGTNAQRIVLFAYYRREVENIATFARQELKAYFAKARLSPPANFDQDFSKAVAAGWIHEDGENSYVTGSGDQLVDHGFQGERVYVPQPKGTKKKRHAQGKRA